MNVLTRDQSNKLLEILKKHNILQPEPLIEEMNSDMLARLYEFEIKKYAIIIKIALENNGIDKKKLELELKKLCKKYDMPYH